MQLSLGILASLCHVCMLCIRGTAAEMISNTGKSEDMPDRVAELDAVLKEHGAEVSTGLGVHKLIEKLEKVSKKVKAKQEIVDYYAQIAELLEREGPDAITVESNRLQEIFMTAPSPDHEDVLKATQQKHVLDAFYEAAANYLIETLDMEGMEGLENLNFHEGNQPMFDANFEQPTIKQKKQKKEKKIKQHEEM